MLSASVVWPPRLIFWMSTLSCTRLPCSAKAGILRGAFTPQDLYPVTGIRLTRWASFRMPSDETLRISQVCMLPLFRFSPSLVAVIQATKPEQVNSSAPALRCFSPLTQPPHPARVYLARYHIPESILSAVSHQPNFSSLVWAILWSVRNP